jgi:hypothetical protein
MLTVTQRCDSCGRRVPATKTCGSCAPSPRAVAAVLSRAAGLWVAAMIAATVVLELV